MFISFIIKINALALQFQNVWNCIIWRIKKKNINRRSTLSIVAEKVLNIIFRFKYLEHKEWLNKTA